MIYSKIQGFLEKIHYLVYTKMILVIMRNTYSCLYDIVDNIFNSFESKLIFYLVCPRFMNSISPISLISPYRQILHNCMHQQHT